MQPDHRGHRRAAAPLTATGPGHTVGGGGRASNGDHHGLAGGGAVTPPAAASPAQRRWETGFPGRARAARSGHRPPLRGQTTRSLASDPAISGPVLPRWRTRPPRLCRPRSRSSTPRSGSRHRHRKVHDLETGPARRGRQAIPLHRSGLESVQGAHRAITYPAAHLAHPLEHRSCADDQPVGGQFW
jgi:hypothetical protein